VGWGKPQGNSLPATDDARPEMQSTAQAPQPQVEDEKEETFEEAELVLARDSGMLYDAKVRLGC
jgi:hypothetical protein